MSHGALHGTACKGCRRRGRKCDRTLPTCFSCKHRGVACEGYITRWPGVAARGKLAGKSIPISDSPVTTLKTNSKIAWQTHSALAGRSNLEDRTPKNLSRRRAESTINNRHIENDNPTALVTLSATDDDLEGLIKHCKKFPSPLLVAWPRNFITNFKASVDIDDLSSIFYLGNGLGQNPMFHYVLPLVDSVPSVRYAIAASAACHIAARTSDNALQQRSLYLRVRATAFLRERLTNPGIGTGQTTLASVLMLAQLDMCSGDCIEFEAHLKAAVAIVRDRQIDHAANRNYFEQRLAWLDIISSTTSTQAPNFTAEELKAALGRFSSAGDREWSYDVFPCPIDLCEMLVDITVLYKTQSDRENPSRETLEKADCIMGRLGEWRFSQNSVGPREHMVEAWRLGIMIYLRRLFSSVHDMSDITTLTTQVLYHAESIPPTTSWSYSLLWPIFQVGVVLNYGASNEKAWIRRRLKLALGAVGCRHFSNALETLEFVWDSHGQQSYNCSTVTFGRTIMLG